MKFFIFSIVLHIFIFIFGFSLDSSKNFEVDSVGNDFTTPSISVNFNSTQVAQQSQPDELPEKISEEVIEEKIEEKIEKPKTEEKKVEVIKKESKKIPKPKKILEKTTTKPIKKTEQLQNVNIPNSNNDLIELSHGVFAAKNQGVQGLKYVFISQPDPEYPLAAKRISYTKEVSIKVRFLVGLNGEIEDIKFYNDKDSLGFQKEVEKTLNKWRLTPVTLNNKPIKLYFYKEFKFNQK